MTFHEFFDVGAVWARIIEPALSSDAVHVFHQPVKSKCTSV